MKPIQFRGKETMSYNKTEPQMNSHPDEIRWNGVDYVKKHLVNQEVERRIKERMPSEEEVRNELCRHLYNWLENNAFKDGCKWLRSRLTPQVTPQDTPQVEKTEGNN